MSEIPNWPISDAFVPTACLIYTIVELCLIGCATPRVC